MIKLQYITTASLILLSGTGLWAQSKSINVVTTAVPFLRITPDAVANGMGGVGIATGPDVNAIYWNQAKLPFTKSKGAITANYSPWLKEWSSDMYLASLAGYYKISDEEAIYGAIQYFNPGNLQFTDNNGNHLQSYKPNEFGVNVGYSRKLSERIGLSLGIKYIRSDLARGVQNGQSFKPGNAVAGDLGLYYDLRDKEENGWSFGATLSNLGTKISYSKNGNDNNFIPANLGLGISYSRVINDQNKILFGLDVNKLLVPTPPNAGDSQALVSYQNKTVVGSWFSSFGDAPGGFKEELKEFQVSIGAEYWYNDQFAIRAGYFYEDKTKGDRKYFTAGASVRYNHVTLNFSYLVPSGNGINKNPLANSLQFGLSFRF